MSNLKKFFKNFANKNNGFTLIEILIVIAIIAILAAIVLVSINPAKRFQDARNSQRLANVESILSAIQQDIVDHKGITTCTINSTVGYIKSPSSPVVASDMDLASCLSSYLAILPVDPQAGSWTDASTYNTKYQVKMDSTTKQVTVTAPQSTSDGSTLISVTR